MHIQENPVSPFVDLVELDAVDQHHDLPLIVHHKKNSTKARGLTGVDAFLSLWIDNHKWMDEQLYQHGAVLFRGFDISEQEIFQSVVGQLKQKLLDYVDGNSPRTKVSSGVYTSTEYPAEYAISMHNELSYTSQWPGRLFFCCIIEPQEGGETPLVSSRDLLRALPKGLVDEFRSKHIRYIRNLHGGEGVGKSWQATFETDSRSDVDAYAAAAQMDARWNDNDSLTLSNIRPATAFHPVTQEEVWFNQADQFHPSGLPSPMYESMLEIYEGKEEQLPQNATFGDGSPIPVEHLDTIRQVTSRERTVFPWRRGDLLMVDNMLAAHGRMPFKGPRRILVSMTAA